MRGIGRYQENFWQVSADDKKVVGMCKHVSGYCRLLEGSCFCWKWLRSCHASACFASCRYDMILQVRWALQHGKWLVGAEHPPDGSIEQLRA